ncbi:MAG: family 16 glycoside hydrolase, partial [Pirellulales bacterium]
GGVWPVQYRGSVFMNNIHGQRINMDILEPRGSGFVGKHGPDFCLTNDRWSQIINLQYGPDGNVFMIDWYDANACHHNNSQGHDRTNGRIFKIVYEGKENPYAKRAIGLDLKKLNDLDLVKMVLEPNEWYVRHARRILQERTVEGRVEDKVLEHLTKILQHDKSAGRRLRAAWFLASVTKPQGGVVAWITDPSPHVRAFAVQRSWPQFNDLNPYFDSLTRIAKTDESPIVRRELASWHFSILYLKELLQHEEDASDHNLPLIYWYALEPFCAEDPEKALELAANGKIPILLTYAVRRIGSLGTPESLATLVDFLGKQETTERQVLVLNGLNAALAGRRKVEPPKSFSAVYAKLAKNADPAVLTPLRHLAVTFGDAAVQDAMRDVLADSSANAALRAEALATLVKAKDAKLPDLLAKLLGEQALRAAAIRAYAAYDDARAPAAILQIYAKATADEKRDALATLASRKSYAHALLTAVAKKSIPATDLSAELVRQLRNLNDDEITKMLNESWGTVRDTAADKAKLIAEYKKLLASPPSVVPEPAHGRAVYAKACGQCHTLFGSGGKVGPDLTGSNRANLDYLLSNVLDPSAVMAKEYQPTVIRTVDGRTVTGILKAEDTNALTILTERETLVIPVDEIDARKISPQSMMPDDLLKPLSQGEVRALVAYVTAPRQAPLLATAENVQSFFNGKDLTGWTADPKLWSVENGELVGRTSGLAHNDWIKSDYVLSDFHFKCQVKLAKNEGNSGIQFRSEVLPNGEVKGYQADVGVGWWGKLYEEHGRGLLWKQSG